MLEINRRGANRLVILTRRHAIKLPRVRSWRDFLYGLLNNLNEARDHQLGGRCPVVARLPGGFAIVMRRAEILSAREFERLDYHGFCRAHRLVAEAKPDSFGILDGRVVAVDYGWNGG
jgi:hypothetical protein